MKKNYIIVFFSKNILLHILLCVFCPLASTFILYYMCQALGLSDTTYWSLDLLKDTIIFIGSGYLVRALSMRRNLSSDRLLPLILFVLWFIFLALLYFTNGINSPFGEPNLYTFFPLYFFIPLYAIGWFFQRRTQILGSS
jgi:hypothetical protein